MSLLPLWSQNVWLPHKYTVLSLRSKQSGSSWKVQSEGTQPWPNGDHCWGTEGEFEKQLSQGTLGYNAPECLYWAFCGPSFKLIQGEKQQKPESFSSLSPDLVRRQMVSQTNSGICKCPWTCWTPLMRRGKEETSCLRHFLGRWRQSPFP